MGWVVVAPNSENPSEAHHGIGDTTAHLVEHHPLDRSHTIATGIVHFGSFNPVAADERACFACGKVAFRGSDRRHWAFPSKGNHVNEVDGAAFRAGP